MEKTAGQCKSDAVRFHTKTWNYKCHFYLETVWKWILSQKGDLYFAFVDLGNSFQRVPRDICACMWGWGDVIT